MHFSKLRSWSIILLGALILSGCKPTSSSSEVVAKMTISDVTIEVGQAAPLTIVFNPVSAAGPITYVVEHDTIVSISDDTAIGLLVGESNVTATSGTMSDTFKVTVTAKNVVTDPVEKFNEYGAITVGLPGFTLTGSNVEAHTVEADNDREGHDEALKFWVDGSPEIDFTLTSSYASGASFLSGDYTLSLELIGNPDDIIVTIETTTYSFAEEEVLVGGSSYEKSYFEFTLTRKKAITFSVQVKSAANKSTWGFLDNIVLAKGHVAPEPNDPNAGNLLLDNGFEDAGKNANLDNNTVWEYNIETGDAALIFWTDSWGYAGSYGLKFSYWPETEVDAVNVVATLAQSFTVTEAGDYALSYYIATEGMPLSSFMILDSESNQIATYPLGTAKSNPHVQRTEASLNLEPGEYTFKMLFTENTQTWANIDEVRILPVTV